MDLPREIARLLREQSGVIARRQVIEAGLTKNDIDRFVRRRDWVRMLPGVSAMRLTAGPGWRQHDDTGPIWVAVAGGRNVTALPGYRIRYLTRFDDQVLGHGSPPRMRFEEACLDLVIATTSPLERIQLLAGACQSRRTTAQRLSTAMAERSRVPDRRWLASVLRDIAEGTCSVLEHGYLTKVERPHGLPRALRQDPGRDSGGRVYRDVAYAGLGQLVELDGRLFHDSPVARDADLERDLDAALVRHDTVRLGWGQVFGRPCRTARKVGILLAQRGWTGTVRRCGPGCEAG